MTRNGSWFQPSTSRHVDGVVVPRSCQRGRPHRYRGSRIVTFAHEAAERGNAITETGKPVTRPTEAVNPLLERLERLVHPASALVVQ